MELRTYTRILIKQKWTVLGVMSLVLATVAVGSSFLETKYTATTSLRLVTITSGGNDFVNYSVSYANRLINTYEKIATSSPIREQVATSLNLAVSELDIVSGAVPDSEILQISAIHSDPQVAAAIANMVANVVIVEGKRDSRVRSNTLTILEPASIPNTPSSLSVWRLIFIGVFIGLGGGISLAFVLENFDTKIYSAKEAASLTKLSVLGEIPKIAKRQQLEGVHWNSLAGEAFRRLRINMGAANSNMPLGTLLVTSAEPDEGKSTIAANLARSMASGGKQQVVVVDCDLRRPTLHRIFEVQNEIGVSDVLLQNVSLNDALQLSEVDGVSILTSGALSLQSIDLLGSSRMKNLLEDLEKSFDTVILDSPALLATADAVVLAPLVKNVLLVVKRAQVSQEDILDTYQYLHAANANLLGVVINQISPSWKRSYIY